MSKTVVIDGPAQFSKLLSSSRLVVTDFYADWCGPCKAIAPIYEQLSAQLSRPNVITFTKVNTDTQKQIAQTYNVTALPTFMIFKNGREIQRIRGADPKQLDSAVKKLAAEASSSDAGGESSGSGPSSSNDGTWSGASLPRGYTDVTSSVEIRGLDFSNLDSAAGTARSVFATTRPSCLSKAQPESSSDDKDWIESDTDEQLMMYIPFQSTMKVHTLHITSCPDSQKSNVTRPRTVHLYINRTNVLEFDEAESLPATQSFVLDDASYDPSTSTAKLELRFVKFQKVTSLVVFVADGLAGDKTRIDRLKIVGESGEAHKMGKLEKIGDEQGE